MLKGSLFSLYLRLGGSVPQINSVHDHIVVQEITKMYDEIDAAPSVFQPSTMWRTVGKKHIAQLERDGLKNFKRTVNQNYFHIMPLYPNKQFRYMLRKCPRRLKALFTNPFAHLGPVDLGDYRFNLSGLLAVFYVQYLRMFYEYTKEKDTKNLLSKLDEPELGNPLRVRYCKTNIAFDVCNSLLECYAIMEHVENTKPVIAELGAGYGRLAYVFLKLHPGCKYVIFDIPPTLYVSQWYLSQLFPNLHIFKFRHFDDFEEIRKEYEQADLCFFSSNQLALFSSKQFDIFINISSLHEMKREQIEAYTTLIDKTTRGYFFTKQYPTTMQLAPDMAGAYEVPFDEYPMPNNWQQIFKRNNDINPLFVEALYCIKQTLSE